MKVTTWNGCYSNQWAGLIVPDAFSHPAKYSPGLIQTIYKHGIRNGYFKKGDLIADCFGGIGGGGIYAAYAGLRWVGCELESKFIDLARQNFEINGPAWRAYGYPEPVIIQGDSRRFSEIVGQVDCIATSPPYADSVNSENHGIDLSKTRRDGDVRHQRMGQGNIEQLHYGKTKGQIGTLKAGDISAVITSPPYADTETSGNRREFTKYDDGLKRDRAYSTDPSNIGNLKVDSIVTSPPWEKGLDQGNVSAKERRELARSKGISNAEYISPIDMENIGKRDQPDYGEAAGQIGNEKQESYWTAMRQVYSECHKVLKPGGYIIVVVKAYVKNKRRVPLPQQTLKLLIYLGFEPIERVKAMLTETSVQGGLFGADVVTTKSRKSFFRRLAEAKGSPEINWEEVLICRK